MVVGSDGVGVGGDSRDVLGTLGLPDPLLHAYPEALDRADKARPASALAGPHAAHTARISDVRASGRAPANGRPVTAPLHHAVVPSSKVQHRFAPRVLRVPKARFPLGALTLGLDQADFSLSQHRRKPRHTTASERPDVVCVAVARMSFESAGMEEEVVVLTGSTDGQLVVWSSTQNVIRGRLQIMDTGDVRVLSPATVSFHALFSCFWC